MPLYLPDANVLIHCLRVESPAHKQCRQWLDEVAKKQEGLALCELVEVAFLRICTLPSLNIAPMEEVMGFWQDLHRYSPTVRLAAGSFHGEIFEGLITGIGLLGNEVNDAWLAALAIEHQAILVSCDSGFKRFPNLQLLNPMAI